MKATKTHTAESKVFSPFTALTEARRQRRRGRATRKRSSRRQTKILGASLAVLLGTFAWSLSYLAPRPEGIHLSTDQVEALAKERLAVTAEFKDEDSLLIGTFLCPPESGVLTGVSRECRKATGEAGVEGRPRRRGSQPTTFWLAYPKSDLATATLMQTMTAAGAQVIVDPQTFKAQIRIVSTFLLPLMILANLFVLLFSLSRANVSGIGEVILFGSIRKGRLAGSRRRHATPVTFADVAGAQEAVTELREVVDYLRDPERYREMGAVSPKGVLMIGPPGCGKTLLAKAVAGEAHVPFFSVAGAEFVESLVGVGAARVRDLFERVRAVAPAIVFIDELDAAGRRRGAGGGGGGADEREQTLNQLLVEMDGFEATAGIVVIGATNRPDILDPALLRPGRFDRHVVVDRPDREGRKAILMLHAKGRRVASGVDFDLLAHRTPGFSGADLANVLNEAALLAVREGKEEIRMEQLVEGVERALSGPQRRGTILSPEERRRVACHEAGHVVAAAALGRAEYVHRVSILARGRTVGSTDMTRAAESAVVTRTDLQNALVTMMSGLAAELLVLGEPSTGSERDLESATRLARDLIARFGMNPRLGRVRLIAAEVDSLLGVELPLASVAEETRREIDLEVRDLLRQAEDRAAALLGAHRATLDLLVTRLEREETIEGADLTAVLAMIAKPARDLETAGVRARPRRRQRGAE